MMWQLIETAPKDGSLVLLFVPADANKVRFGYYVESEYFSYGVSIDATQGWVVQNQSIAVALPTHWQPLPADPE